jgi:hypothetical protein
MAVTGEIKLGHKEVLQAIYGDFFGPFQNVEIRVTPLPVFTN